jgi:alpha-glucosidase (family GH31 glycosyl hydrolase)
MTHITKPAILKGLSLDTRVIRYSEHAIRITHKPKIDPDFPENRPWFKDVMMGMQAKVHRCDLSAEMVDDCIQVKDAGGNTLFLESHPAEILEDGRMILKFSLEENEGIYGFGEWFNGFRRTNGRLKLTTRESPAILQGHRTYSTLPLFLSYRNYAVFVLNSHSAEVSFARKGKDLTMKFDGPPSDYILIGGRTPKEIICEYTRLTGRPPLLPRWAFGLLVTSYPQETQDKVIKMIAGHRARNIPLDGVILDYHWEQRFHDFQWRKSLFPNPGAFLDRVKKLGIHLGLIFTPFMNHTNLILQKNLLNLLFHNLPEGVEQEDERDLPGYKEGHNQNYFTDDDTS